MQLPTFQEYLGEMAVDHQNRGICQVCGREQAVRDKGNITHHGYTIEYGWFMGACPGQQHPPLQVSKDETLIQIAKIEKELPAIEKRISKLHSGAIHPLQIKTNRSERVNGKFRAIMIDWEDASPYDQSRAVKSAIWDEERRLKAGKDTITFLHNLISTYYGKDLKRVEKVDKKKMEVGSVVNIAGKKNVVITKIENRRVSGVGPNLNGQYLDHAFWTDEKTGREHSYPLRLARWPK